MVTIAGVVHDDIVMWFLLKSWKNDDVLMMGAELISKGKMRCCKRAALFSRETFMTQNASLRRASLRVSGYSTGTHVSIPRPRQGPKYPVFSMID